VLAAMSKTKNGTLEPSIGEAFAASSIVCRDLEVQHVVLEGDAKQIVDAVNSSSTWWSRFGHLIDDTRRILESFPQWKCQFVRHEANEAVDRLAKTATTNVNDRIWRDVSLSCISDIDLIERLALSCAV
jgi:ribonuclease HI